MGVPGASDGHTQVEIYLKGPWRSRAPGGAAGIVGRARPITTSSGLSVRMASRNDVLAERREILRQGPPRTALGWLRDTLVEVRVHVQPFQQGTDGLI